MIRRPPRSTRTDTLFPYTTLFRSHPMATTLISALQWWSRETPDNIALRVGDTAVGYAELDRWTAKIAARLVAEGIRPGDRVGAIAGTSLAHCALLIGSVRAGALASPLSTRLSQRETGEIGRAHV